MFPKLKVSADDFELILGWIDETCLDNHGDPLNIDPITESSANKMVVLHMAMGCSYPVEQQPMSRMIYALGGRTWSLCSQPLR